MSSDDEYLHVKTGIEERWIRRNSIYNLHHKCRYSLILVLLCCYGSVPLIFVMISSLLSVLSWNSVKHSRITFCAFVKSEGKH